jgi:hypothetical protein
MIGIELASQLLHKADRRRRKSARKPVRRFTPALEGLESRTLLSFAAPRNFAVDGEGRSLATADLTGSGNSDLVVTGPDGGAGTSHTVSILLGNGDGTFQRARNVDVGPSPYAVAIGDFNGDLIPDLAVTHAGAFSSDFNTVSILLGNGDGTFRAAGDLQVGRDPRAIAVGDLRGDGMLDLVTANTSSNTVSVLLGNGDGTFQSAVDLPVEPNPIAVSVVDLNGHLSIVTANVGVIGGDDGGSVSVLLGNGDGTFQSAVTLGLGNAGSRAEPRSLAVADLTGSGILDLVTANDSDDGGTVSIFMGNGDGTFKSAVTYPVVHTGGDIFVSNPLAVAVGNFDGQQDLIVSNVTLFLPARGSLSQLFLLSGNGDGTFGAPVAMDAGASPFAMTVGHFASDGNLDVAASNAAGGDVTVLLGNGDGTFNMAPDYPTGRNPISLAQGDFKRDGVVDLVTANSNADSVSVLIGNGNGTFQAPVGYSVGHQPTFVTVADLRNNGIQDIIVANVGTNRHGT